VLFVVYRLHNFKKNSEREWNKSEGDLLFVAFFKKEISTEFMGTVCFCFSSPFFYERSACLCLFLTFV
jgi:hypothetical protein